MTLGEYRVGISFNPSNNKSVEDIKARAASLIDYVNELPVPDGVDPGEFKRMVALASTCFEDGAMWGVKAATKRPRE